MPIMVTTGGPITPLTPPQTAKSLTYRDLIHQISDELDDTNNSYLPQIQTAAAEAIRFCAREPFYFNQNHEIVLTTRAGCAQYSSGNDKLLAKLGSVSAVYCDDAGQIFRLERKSAKEFASFEPANTANNRPFAYCFLNNQLCLYPTPDKAYFIKLLLNPIRLPDIATPDTSSPWLDSAFDLIKARTKYDVYKDIIKDASLAAVAFSDFKEEEQVLNLETSRRSGIEHICATRF